MTRVKSLSHGIKTIANPFESPHIKTSPYHRTHRSPKNKRPDAKYKADLARDYKKRKEEIKLTELENEKRQAIKKQGISD
jgi:hypothetical protein